MVQLEKQQKDPGRSEKSFGIITEGVRAANKGAHGAAKGSGTGAERTSADA